MERVIRCVSYLAMYIVTHALIVCKQMKGDATQSQSAAVYHPVLLVQAARDSWEVLKDAQAGGAGITAKHFQKAHRKTGSNVEHPMPAGQSLADMCQFFSRSTREAESAKVHVQVTCANQCESAETCCPNCNTTPGVTGAAKCRLEQGLCCRMPGGL